MKIRGSMWEADGPLSLILKNVKSDCSKHVAATGVCSDLIGAGRLMGG